MKWNIWLAGALTVVLSAVTFGQTPIPEVVSPETKSIAPNFSLVSLKGKKFDLAELRGKVVVLNFWFTGCEPCVKEMPELNKFVKEFKDQGVVFIAPTWDREVPLRGFLKKHRFKYHVVPNAGGIILGPYSEGTGSIVFPMHIVIHRAGNIRTRIAGSEHLEELRQAISQAVKEAPETAKE